MTTDILSRPLWLRIAFRTLPTVVAATAIAISTNTARADEIHLGSGVKAGEITDTSAIVLVRLTATDGQDSDGLIPGREGLARVLYATDESLADPKATDWMQTTADKDYSAQFVLEALEPAHRYFYRVEYKRDASAEAARSDVFSFLTAPRADERQPVMFHLTTCQDYRGAPTYTHMAAQKPDFCISAGDTVYYDGQGLARTVPQAYEAYQKMFGLPEMKDYYRNVGGYFMKDDHDYRFNDSDPYMKGKWVSARNADPGAKFSETDGNRGYDVAWMSHEEGVNVFKTVFPMHDKTYRTIRWGKGLQVWMVENRDYRSPNAMDDGPEKSIWGKEQKAWLMETLLASDADYRIIVSPNPIIGPDRIMKGDNHANLNGFWHEAQTFLDWLKDNKMSNVIVMCGDRHWQYHSIDRRNGRTTHEFSCGPTCDEHVQAVPPPYEGVDRPYSASRGGFLAISYDPDGSLAFQYYSQEGEPLYRYNFER